MNLDMENKTLIEESVTVYLITKNRLTLLKRALSSVLEQTYRPLELIVIDDGSDDGTQEYLGTFKQTSSISIKIFRFERSQGACAARNKAIAMATSKFITGLDDDDYFHKDRVASLHKFYISQTSSFVFANDAFIIDNKIVKNTNKKNVVRFNDILFQNYVGNQIFTETKKLVTVGMFDTTLSAAQDYDLWVRLIEAYGPAKNEGKVLQFVETQSDNRITKSNKKFVGYFNFYKKYKYLMSANQKKFQLLNIKYACRSNISTRTFIILFSPDLPQVKRRIRIFLVSVLGFRNNRY